VPLLIIDVLLKGEASSWASQFIKEAAVDRYSGACYATAPVLLLTSNRPIEDWVKLLSFDISAVILPWCWTRLLQPWSPPANVDRGGLEDQVAYRPLCAVKT